MQLSTFLPSFVAATVIANAASACDPVIDSRSPSEIRSHSKRVAVDQQCRTINAGVFDGLSLGPAIDLGNGVIQQDFGAVQRWDDLEENARILLADCNIREATILQGKVTSTQESSCGPIDTYADLAGPKALMKFDTGASYHELIDIALSKGVTEISPSEYFFTFAKPWETERYPVSRKDRFDLLCGCKLFYPDSAGAKN